MKAQSPRTKPLRSSPSYASGLLSLSLVAACGGGKTEAPDQLQAKDAQNAAPLPVQTATLEAAGFVDSITLYGQVEAEERVRLMAELPGRIEAVPFREGQRVAKGQVLARINARLATAQVDQAKAGAELASATLARTEALHQRKLASGQDLEVARAQAAQARAALDIVQANLDKAVVRAPISGQATRVLAKVGEMASPGIPLLEIVNLRRVKIEANAPEGDIALLQSKSKVNVSFEAYPGRVFEGYVSQIGLVANPTTRTFPLEITLENESNLLRPGMLARVTLVRQRFDQVVVVPRDAVLDEVDGKSAYVIEGQKARRSRVVLGPARGAYAVVQEGLRPGQELIVLGHRQVVDGQRIEVIKNTKCCNDKLSDKDGEQPAPMRLESVGTTATLPAKG